MLSQEFFSVNRVASCDYTRQVVARYFACVHCRSLLFFFIWRDLTGSLDNFHLEIVFIFQSGC